MAPITAPTAASFVMTRDDVFDPYEQYLNLTLPDGTSDSFNINQIFYLQHLATVSGIIFGTQVGITGILMLILVVMTKPDKRRSIVFILNLGALICTCIRSILLCIGLTGAFYNFYNWITQYYVSVGAAQRINVTEEVFSTLGIIFIELSMMFQVRIVCCTLRDLWRRVVDIVSVVVVLAVVAVRFALCVLNSDWGITHVEFETLDQLHTLNKLASASNILTACSIIFFSGIFCVKLGHAILERRKLGMKPYGPMQIIFIMGCQTLIIPAIFGILAYIALKSAQLNTFMPVIVATFLPLSSMWAASSTNNAKRASAHDHPGHRNFPIGKSDPYESGTGLTEKRLLNTTGNTDHTFLTEDTQSSFKNETPNKLGDVRAAGGGNGVEAQMQKIGQNIHIDRTYSVHSD